MRSRSPFVCSILKIQDHCESFGVFGIYTRRFNQDISENFFGQIKRSVSKFTCQKFRTAFRANIIHAVSLDAVTNCEPDEDSVLTEDRSDEIVYLDESGAESEDELSHFFSTWSPTDADEHNGKSELSKFFSEFEPFRNIVNEEESSDSNAIAYFAGYIIKHIKKSIDCCLCIDAVTRSDQADYTFLTSMRAYGENCHLNLPSKEFFDTVKKSVIEISKNIDDLIYTVPLRRNLARSIEKSDYSFIPECHRASCRLKAIGRTVNTLLSKYIKDKNIEFQHGNKRKKIRKK